MATVRQLIYRQERGGPFGDPPVGGVRVRLLRWPTDIVPVLPSLLRTPGPRETVTLALRLATPRRLFYGVFAERDLVSYGYVTMSRCRYYDVDDGAAVLGPVWTSPASRGKGYATLGIRSALDRLLSAGVTVFYIDTSERNGVMQRVVEKCGFGAPIGEFPKTVED